jgi:HlyD family secretion protein
VSNPAPRTTASVEKTIGVGRRSRRWVAWPIAALLLIGLAALGVRAFRARAASRAPAYVTEQARRGDIRVVVTATGTLEAVTTVEVGAEVTGRVLKLTVDENEAVKKGQVLAVIDPEQLRAALDQAMAQVASSQASILQAKATVTETTLALERTRLLRAEGLLGQGEQDAAVASKQRAEANLASAMASASVSRASLKQAKSKLDKSTIYSPIDGIVLARLVELGQTVTAGFQTPVLFKLAQDLTQMRLKVGVDEADVGRVRGGEAASFTVEAYPEKRFPSKVLSVGNDPKTSQNVVTYQAILAVDNQERLLRPGMTCTATIVAETRQDVLVVPNAALRFTPPPAPGAPGGAKQQQKIDPERKQRIWVLKAGVPVAVDVRAGASDGSVTEILQGDLPASAAIIVDVSEPP